MHVTSRVRRLAACGAVLLPVATLACSDGPSGPPGPTEYPVTLEPAEQWAGNEIELRWGYLAHETPTGFFLAPAGDFLGGDLEDGLAFHRTADSTAILQISRRRQGGPADLHAILQGGDTVRLGAMEVGGRAGFEQFSTYPDELECPASPWPWDAPSAALTCFAGRIVLIDPKDPVPIPVGPAGGLTPWADGYGMSYRPGVVVAPLGPDSVLLWNTHDGAEVARIELEHGGRRAVEMGTGTWALLADDAIEVLGANPATHSATEVDRVLFSPDGEFVVFLASPSQFYGSDRRSLVLRTGDGGFQARLPDMGRVMGAGFKSALMIAVASVTPTGTPSVALMNIQSGGLLATGGPYYAAPLDLVVDPGTGRLYLVGESGDAVFLTVLEGSNLTEAAVSQGYGGGCYACLEAPASIVSADGRSLHFVIGSWVHHYTLVP